VRDIKGRSQEEPGGARRSQEAPGGARKSQEEPGGAKRRQEEPGGARRGSFSFALLHKMCWSFGIITKPFENPVRDFKSQSQSNHNNHGWAAFSRPPSILSFVGFGSSRLLRG